MASVVVAFIIFKSLERPAEHFPSVGSSPLDHAERILAGRYARREITTDQYRRMLAVLRR